MYRVLVIRSIDLDNKTFWYSMVIQGPKIENEAELEPHVLVASFDQDRVLYDISVDHPIPDVDLANLAEGYFKLWTTTWHLLFWQIKDKFEKDGIVYEHYVMNDITDLEATLERFSVLYPSTRPPKTKDEKIRELVNFYNEISGAVIPIDPDQKYQNIVFSFWARGIEVSSYLTYGQPYDDLFAHYTKYPNLVDPYISDLNTMTPSLFRLTNKTLKNFLQNSLNMRPDLKSYWMDLDVLEVWRVFNENFWLKLKLSGGKRLITYKQFRVILEKTWQKRDLVYFILAAHRLHLFLRLDEVADILPPETILIDI